MKRTLIVMACLASSGAFAADVGFPAYKAAPINFYNWSGGYVGIHGGYVGGDVTVNDINGGVAPGPFGYNVHGGVVGGQAGYNFTLSNFLLGIEGDIGYMALSGKGVIGSANAAAHQDLTLKSGMYGDITGRFGYTFNQFMVYGKGGYAYFDTDAKQQTTNPGYTPTGTGSLNGAVYGGGVEYMFAPNWTLKAEYLRYEFDTKGGYQTSVSDPPIGYKYLNTHTVKLDTVKVGVNYKF